MLSLVVSTPRKTASIMTILEQMVETRAWKVVGWTEEGRCRVCFQHRETVEHIVSRCRVLAGSEYLTRHNNIALMILDVAWAKEHELTEQIP